MNYQMDRANNLYIIRVDSLNDVIFQKVIKEILCIRGLEKKVYAYYTYFTKDYSYCILDFNKRKFNLNDVEKIARQHARKFN